MSAMKDLLLRTAIAAFPGDEAMQDRFMALAVDGDFGVEDLIRASRTTAGCKALVKRCRAAMG